MSEVSEQNAKQKWIDYLSLHSLDRLAFPEWAEIMGIPLGPKGLYVIDLSGVRVNGFRDIRQTADPQEQAIMVRINNLAPLTFPCTLQALLDFVEGPAGQVGGIHFTLPEGFREAAAEALAQSFADQAECGTEVRPTSGECSTTGGSPMVGAGGTAETEEPETKNWMLLIQAEAAKRWKLLRDVGANPTKHNIKDDLANWCRETGVLTDGDINPNAEYIYRHVLRKWTPPKG